MGYFGGLNSGFKGFEDGIFNIIDIKKELWLKVSCEKWFIL